MDLSLARVVRRLTSVVRESATDGEYQCRRCATRYQRRYQVCPHCGGFRVERREW